MTAEQTTALIDCLASCGIRFEAGLTDIEVAEVQEKFGFVFPPDLKQLLQQALPVTKSFVNWRKGLHNIYTARKIKARMKWPSQCIGFYVEDHSMWLPEWGDKPIEEAEKLDVVKKNLQSVSKLIPIYSHRYIPAQPSEEGNPVFSVYHTDTIYYGYDLPNYLANEFLFTLPGIFTRFEGAKEHIEFNKGSGRLIKFWSELAT